MSSLVGAETKAHGKSTQMTADEAHLEEVFRKCTINRATDRATRKSDFRNSKTVCNAILFGVQNAVTN